MIVHKLMNYWIFDFMMISKGNNKMVIIDSNINDNEKERNVITILLI